MRVTIEEIEKRQEPIDCIGMKARRGGSKDWIVALEEYYNYEMEFDMSNIELLDTVNSNQGKRYRKCIAWHNSAGYNHACFEMCDEWQRNMCSKQQEEDKSESEAPKN